MLAVSSSRLRWLGEQSNGNCQEVILILSISQEKRELNRFFALFFSRNGIATYWAPVISLQFRKPSDLLKSPSCGKRRQIANCRGGQRPGLGVVASSSNRTMAASAGPRSRCGHGSSFPRETGGGIGKCGNRHLAVSVSVHGGTQARARQAGVVGGYRSCCRGTGRRNSIRIALAGGRQVHGR